MFPTAQEADAVKDRIDEALLGLDDDFVSVSTRKYRGQWRVTIGVLKRDAIKRCQATLQVLKIHVPDECYEIMSVIGAC